MTPDGGSDTHWEGRAVDEWAGAWGVPAVVVFASTPSTNDAARARAEAGAPAGLVVLSDHQSEGRGRHRRRWLDRPRTAVLLSFLIRPRGGASPGTAPLRVGMAAAAALREATGVPVGLKWPNDLVVPGAGKVGGILCEAAGTGTAGGYIVAGIGINVHAHPDRLDEAYPATSLDHVTGGRNDRSSIAGSLVRGLVPLRDVALDPMSAAELRSFADLDVLYDEFVTVDGETDACRARGIDDNGALLVERNGSLRRVTAATVRPTRTAAST